MSAQCSLLNAHLAIVHLKTSLTHTMMTTNTPYQQAWQLTSSNSVQILKALSHCCGHFLHFIILHSEHKTRLQKRLMNLCTVQCNDTTACCRFHSVHPSMHILQRSRTVASVQGDRASPFRSMQGLLPVALAWQGQFHPQALRYFTTILFRQLAYSCTENPSMILFLHNDTAWSKHQNLESSV